MTNERTGNHVVALARRSNGRLRRVGSYSTGGLGSGSFEDTANSLVLGTSRGEAAPNNLIEDVELLRHQRTEHHDHRLQGPGGRPRARRDAGFRR